MKHVRNNVPLNMIHLIMPFLYWNSYLLHSSVFLSFFVTCLYCILRLSQKCLALWRFHVIIKLSAKMCLNKKVYDRFFYTDIHLYRTLKNIKFHAKWRLIFYDQIVKTRGPNLLDLVRLHQEGIGPIFLIKLKRNTK